MRNRGNVTVDSVDHYREVYSQVSEGRQMAQRCRYIRESGFMVAPYSFKARDNIRIFANVCVRLGMRRSDVCNYSNFEKSDLKQITATLCAFAKLGMRKGLKKVQEDLEQYVESCRFGVPS